MRRADEIDGVVGDNIRLLRLDRRMSQETLAERIGVTFQQVQKYEKGANRVGASRLWRIAAVFEVPVGQLYTGLDAPTKQVRSPLRMIAKRDPLKLLAAFDKIKDPRMRRSIIVLVQMIASRLRV
jgi:transcriptional regulator with XRE-family HTH domain